MAAPKKTPKETSQKREKGEEKGLDDLRNLSREMKLRAMAQSKIGSRRMKCDWTNNALSRIMSRAPKIAEKKRVNNFERKDSEE